MSEQPPVMWTRCHLCGKTVRTDECVREWGVAKSISSDGWFFGNHAGAISHSEDKDVYQLIDICIGCKSKSDKQKEEYQKNLKVVMISVAGTVIMLLASSLIFGLIYQFLN